ncbi:MAG: hypothetical protein MR004_01475 [Clostridiales bacterium]|nr:hypothetical protein [Clostridiales bacterium]MDY4037096.1 hypothetical protein [Candidatus Pseudoscilispira sp.]
MVTNQLQRQVYTLFADSSSFCSAKFQNKKFFILFWDICGNFCAKMRERKEIWFVFLLLRFCIFSRSMGRGGTVAACNGVGFVLLGRRGNGCAPHFFFSRERKRNVPISAPRASLRSVALRNAPAGAGPVQRKRALGAAFVTKAASFSLVLYVLMAVPWCCADWFYRLRRCR